MEKLLKKLQKLLVTMKNVFLSKEEFEQRWKKSCTVSSISTQDGAIVLEFKKWICNTPDLDSGWARAYKRKNGEEPSFF